MRDQFYSDERDLIGIIIMLNYIVFKVLVSVHYGMRASIYTTPMVLLVALAADFGRFYT